MRTAANIIQPMNIIKLKYDKMEKYVILNNLPKHQMFSLWDKTKVKEFGKWFYENKKIRLKQFIDEVHRDSEYQMWNSDYSPDSLKQLGNWFIKRIQANSRRKEVYNSAKSAALERDKIQHTELTDYIISLSFDLSIYYGEVILNTLKDRHWVQNIKTSVNDLEYGCMVIPKIYNKLCVTPWRNIGVYTLKISAGIIEDNWLYVLYLRIIDYLKKDHEA